MEIVEVDRIVSDIVLYEVFKYLKYSTLIRVSEVCKQWNEVAASNQIWKPQCKYFWLVDKLQNRNSWKEEFHEIYKDNGKYIDVYRQVKGAWNSIETWYGDNCLLEQINLQCGATEDEVQEFESLHKVKLPMDLRLSYKIHKGQNFGIPLLGHLYDQTDYGDERFVQNFLLPLADVSIFYQETSRLRITGCFKPEIAFDLVQLLDENDNLGKNPVVAIPLFKGADRFLVAESFGQWLADFANKLTSNVYFFFDGKLMVYDVCTEVKATTGHITVAVRWAFVPGFKNQATYHYFISMEMAEDAPEEHSCKLESRFWQSTDDSTHKTDTASGSGVVGEYPVMRPGTKFCWQSMNWFKESGSMKGHFVMYRLNDPGFKFNVLCPEFKMYRPWQKYPQ